MSAPKYAKGGGLYLQRNAEYFQSLPVADAQALSKTISKARVAIAFMLLLRRLLKGGKYSVLSVWFSVYLASRAYI